MKNIKNKFYGQLKVNKEIRQTIKFFNKIKPKMISELARSKGNVK